MTDFAENVPPKEDYTANQLSHIKGFVAVFDERREDIEKILKQARENYRADTFSSYYVKKQTQRLENLVEVFKNTSLTGISALIDRKSVREFGNADEEVKRLITDYSCKEIHSTLEDFLETFFKSWRGKVRVGNKEIKTHYTKPLEDHLKLHEDFKQFPTEIIGKEVKKFVEGLPHYTQEVRTCANLLDLFRYAGNQVEKEVNNSTLREEVERLEGRFHSYLDRILNANILFLEENVTGFNERFYNFLHKETNENLEDKEVLNVSQKVGNPKERGKVRRVVFSDIKEDLREKTLEQLRKGVKYTQQGKPRKGKTCLEEALNTNPELSQAHFYLGIGYLQRVFHIWRENPEDPKEKFEELLSNSIKRFEKSLESCIGETLKFKSQIKAFTAYSRFWYNPYCREETEKVKNLENIVNQSLRLSENSTNRFIKADILIKNYEKHTSEIPEESWEKSLELLQKVNGRDLEKFSLNWVSEDEKERNKALALMYGYNKPSEALNILKKLETSERKRITYYLMNKIYLDRGESEDKKPAKRCAKEGLSAVQDKINKFKDNEELVKFVTNTFNWWIIYRNYANSGGLRGRTAKKVSEQMKNKGKFKKIRLL